MKKGLDELGTRFYETDKADLEVGTIINEEDIESLPTGRGRKWMLNENPIWISAMNEANGKFVVLEKLPLTTTTKSRIANRVVKYNKTFETYKFKSKSLGDYIYFFGASC